MEAIIIENPVEHTRPPLQHYIRIIPKIDNKEYVTERQE